MMNRSDVIRLAKEAGIFNEQHLCVTVDIHAALKFAGLVEAETRERCAALCENYTKETKDMVARGCLVSVAFDIRALKDEQ